jgi:transposase InsO family protein
VRFTDARALLRVGSLGVSPAQGHDLITSPAFIVMKAADEFKDKTTAPNQLWQTDFTYLKVTGWGWFYLSTVLDDFSRCIVAWKLCTTMKAEDVTSTLELALQDQPQLEVVHGLAHQRLVVSRTPHQPATMWPRRGVAVGGGLSLRGGRKRIGGDETAFS